MAAQASSFRLALVQLAVGSNKATNLSRAAEKVREAAQNGSKIVALPECFNSPYGTQYFKDYAEEVPAETGQPGPGAGESCKALSQVARECGVFLVGGSIPEVRKGKYYNTSMSFGPDGALLGVFRKVHLFDIDIPGKQKFKESDILSPGDKLLSFDTDWCKVGIGICYDLRFYELASIYGLRGCKLLLYPGAFNTTTGPLHFELLIRGLAANNQLFVAGVSPAQDLTASYHAWGHSMLCNPWGKVVVSADEKEGIVYGEVDLSEVDRVRSQIPVTAQKRWDLYSITDKTNI
ncbi:Omega-amidase NIT2 [Geodia barretti]|uniref:omega-amidase n=1 Tax=Geodia barretti TaxID=519541 RepID=A0AA35SG14_GEOBA|nr:Omega-amidase NIT2 [Geodia barretti]